MHVLSKALVFFWVTTILVASTCFGADIHYCKGEVQSFSIYDVAEPCNMHKKKPVKIVEDDTPPCCKARKTVQKQPLKGFPVAENGKCCYNDQVAFKTDSDTQPASIDIQKVGLEKTTVLPSQYFSAGWEGFYITNPPFRGPPDRIFRDNLQIFFQVFRI